MAMSLAAPVPTARTPGLPLAIGFAALALGAAVLAGGFPVALSIAVVFLFAGPHNWFEARYILGRLPARTGKLLPFFVVSFLGIVGLTAGFAALHLIPSAEYARHGPEYVAGWCTLLVLWVATLVQMRANTAPRFDAGWVWAAAFGVLALVWLWPFALPALLVYAHPCVALVLLDRELYRSHRSWRPAYRWAVLAVPALLLVLFWKLHDAPDLPETDPLTATICRHADGGFLTGVSTHFLVAAHTFLETVHYGVWVLLIPLIGLRSKPWEVKAIPAARRNRRWARGVAALLLFGLFVVAVLWAAFLTDYGTTRTIYFTVAFLHVLAEVPFVLRMV